MPLSEACLLVPAPTPSGHAGASTLHRWILAGRGGVKLEACRVKGKLQTSAAAVGRFLNAVADRDQQRKEAVWG
jgi:hypothetical protein